MVILFGATARAEDPPTVSAPARNDALRLGSVRVDAIFVKRGALWWLVDDGVRRTSSPRWTADASAARVLGVEGVRVVLDAIERGEGGGLADETGLGTPLTPLRAMACGIPLVAGVRDVAVVFVRDATGWSRAVRASRSLESGGRGALARAAQTSSPDPGLRERNPGPLGPLRRCALLGDALETLRLAHEGRSVRPPVERASLDLLEAQACERLGHFDEAANALLRFAEGTGARPRDDLVTADAAAEARRQATRVSARSPDARSPDVRSPGVVPNGSVTAADRPPRGRDLDDAFGALPRLAVAGREAEGIKGVADAVRDAAPGTPARSNTRRRALLAAAALALAEGDRSNARVLLAPLCDASLPDELSPLLDALLTDAGAVRARGASPPGPPVGKSGHGG